MLRKLWLLEEIWSLNVVNLDTNNRETLRYFLASKDWTILLFLLQDVKLRSFWSEVSTISWWKRKEREASGHSSFMPNKALFDYFINSLIL